MKTIFTLLFASLSMATYASSMEQAGKDTCKNDSTRMHFKDLEIIVIGRNNCNTDTTRANKEKKQEEKRNLKFSNWNGIYLGVNGYTTPSGNTNLGVNNRFLELDYSKSITFGINFAEVKFKIVPKYVSLATGLGIQWNKYGFKNNYSLTYNQDSVFGIRDTMFTFTKNKLTATYLQIPLLLEFRTSSQPRKAFHMGFGVIGAFKIGSSLKQKYESGGFESQGRIKGHYQLNPFELYATARLGYGKRFDVFFNYGLNGLFESGKGPDLRPFTVGIYLPF